MLRVLVCCVAILAPAVNALQAPATSTLGRALYRGDIAFSKAPEMHDVALPQTGGCARCHGESGRGSREAGINVPPITGAALTSPRLGSRAYENIEAALAGLRTGESRTRSMKLAAAMPRYDLTERELSALALYLTLIGSERDDVAGVSAEAIRFGSLLPNSGPLVEAGREIENGMNAAIARINNAGGVYGRRLELIVEPLSSAAAVGKEEVSYREAVRKLRERDVFAIVGAWQPSLSATEGHDLPFIASMGLAATDVQASSLRYLLASLQLQIARIVQQMDESCPGKASALVIVRGEDSALQEAIDRSGVLARRDSGVGETGPALHPRVLQLGRAALKDSTPSCIGRLAVLSGGSAARTGETTEIMLFPAPMVLVEDKQTTLWRSLSESSVALFADAISRAGRKLDRQRLIQVLGSPDGFHLPMPLHNGESRLQKIQFTNRSATGLATPHMISRGSYATVSE